MPYADRTTLNNLTPNLDIGDIADPALRLAFFQYIINLMDANYAEMQNLVPVGAVTPAPPAFLSRQAMINGGFQIAQRGTTFTNPAIAAYTLDRYRAWQNPDGGVLPTMIHSQQAMSAGELPAATYFYRINTNGPGSNLGGNSYVTVTQLIERGTRYLCGVGNKVTLSFYARSSIPNKRIGVRFTQSYGTGGAPSAAEIINGGNFALTNSWKKCTITVDTNALPGKTFGSNNDDSFNVELFYAWGATIGQQVGADTAETLLGSGNIDIALLQLCAGDVDLPFQPRSVAEELLLCKRYFEKSYNFGVAPGTVTATGSFWADANGTANPIFSFVYEVEKRIMPTLTFYNPSTGATGTIRDVSSSVDLNASVGSSNGTKLLAFFANGAPASGNDLRVHYTSDAEF